MRRRDLAAALGLLTASATVTACTEPGGRVTPASPGSDGGGAAGSTSSATTGPAADPGEPVEWTETTYGRSPVTMGVRPVVRSGEHLVLTIDLTAEDPEDDLADLGVAYYVSRGWGGSSLDFREGMGSACSTWTGTGSPPWPWTAMPRACSPRASTPTC